jgi:hypothetical protein
LAALTYELLTGKTPFDAPDERQALVLASSGEFQAASALVRGVPPEVDDVLFAALAPDPAQRYADVEAYSSALLPHLGSPRVGAARLADVVADLGSDELAEEDQAYERLGLWDRMAHMASPATRVGAVLVCGWLSWLAFKQLGVGPIPTFAAVALVALAAAFAPSLGTALALGAMALGAFKIGWLPGLVVLPFAALFWLGLGRRGRGDSLLALASPALATAWLAPAAPLLLGFTFSPVWAATSSAAACVLVMTASALSRAHPPLLNVGFRLLTNPWAPASTPGALGPLVSSAGPLLAITAWAAAGAVVSVACSRGTRGWAAVGTLAGAGIMFGAYATWSELAAPFIGTNTVALQHIVASLILMCVVIALGPPVRGEETADEAGTEEQDS